MILITGSGGKTGRAVAASLRKRGHELRLFRRESRQRAGDRTSSMGDNFFVGDLENLVDVSRACRGIEAIYHIGPNMHPAEDQIGYNVIEAAKANQVEHFVYHSVLFPQIEAMPHHWRKLKVEQALIQSGLAFTILQPAAYFQNFGNGWDEVQQMGEYRVPYPVDTRLSLVDLVDVARAAAEVLLNTKHYYATYPLASRSAPSQVEVAEKMTEVARTLIEVSQIGQHEWAQAALERGMAAGRVDDFLAMFSYYGQHDFIGSGETLAWLIGQEPAGLGQYLQRLTAAD